MATLCNIYKFYHATHENVAATCSKIESILFCCTLQQHFLTIFCYTARKKHLWDTVQFFHAHATQQIALHAHEKIAPWSLTFNPVRIPTATFPCLFSLSHVVLMFRLDLFFLILNLLLLLSLLFLLV